MSMPKVIAGPRRSLVARLVANGLAQATCGFGLALSLRELMHGAEHGRVSWPWLATMIGIGVSVMALRVLEAGDAERLGQDYVMRVRLRIFDRVAERPARLVGRRRYGVTITRLVSDLSSLRNWVSLGIARLVVATISIAGLLSSLCYFSPVSAATVLGVMIVCIFGIAIATPHLRSSVVEARRRRGRLTNNLSEKVLAARAVWQLGRADRERIRIRRQSGQLRDALIRRARLSAVLRSSSEIGWPLAVASVLATSIAMASPASELVIAVLLVGMIMSAMGRIAQAWDYRIAFDEGRRRIGELLEGPRIREARDAVALPGSAPLELTFEGVTAGDVLHGVRLRARAGDRVLVVGPAGAGKSTLLALAARMAEPDAGEIRLDGIEIARIELDALHQAVQLVSAELPLLRGTVAENVGYAAPDEGEGWLSRVAEACCLTDDPALAHDGLDLRVEEQGANLSQGLRHRILLARAVAARPRLLLVDEPHLLADPRSRTALVNAIALTGATVLIVADEAGPIPEVDQVWRLPVVRVASPSTPDPTVEGILLH